MARYAHVRESGLVMRKTMSALMKKLLEFLDKKSDLDDLETQDFTPVDVDRVRAFLRKNIKKILPFVEKKIKAFVNLTFKKGLLASVSKNETTKRIMPADVKNLKRMQSYWVNAFKGLTDEMQAQVSSTVNDGLRDNADPKTIKSRIRNIFEVNEKAKRQPEEPTKANRMINRAEMIGRTLIVEGFNSARVERDKSSGVVWGHEWITSDDEKVCPICGGRDIKGNIVNRNPMDGQKVPIDGFFETSFKNRTYRVKHPPAHIHCRCRVVAVTFIEAKKQGLL